MDVDLRKLTALIKEADKLADEIAAAGGGMQIVEQNIVRIKACLKMLRIGVVEPLEMAG